MDFSILGKKIPLGKGAQVNLNIAKLHTRTAIEVPVIIERGKKPGPVLLITGGIHGDEVNGVEIVRQLIAKKLNKPKCGTVICIPVVNVFGFLNLAREFPDGRDLNRVFPGNSRGSLASQFAYYLMKEVVPLADYCLDFHTGGAERFNAAQIRINADDEESFKLAQIFGAPFILKSKNREKSYRYSAAKMGKKVLLFEGGKSLDINVEISAYGVNGALNLMRHLGMIDSAFETNEKTVVIEKSRWLRAASSGFFIPKVENGKYYEKGTIVGELAGPFGDFIRKVKAPVSGYVFCVNEAPIVNRGDAIMHISEEI